MIPSPVIAPERLTRRLAKARQIALNAEWSALDDIMDELGRPIEAEMEYIFDQQLEEAEKAIDEAPENKVLTEDDIFDFAKWLGLTALNIAAFIPNIIRVGFIVGFRQVGKTQDEDILEIYIQDAIRTLTPLNEKITINSRDKIRELAMMALTEGWSRNRFKGEIHDLFTRWKVWRPHGVSVFNVTYPFNSGLFRAYKRFDIRFKAWISQRDRAVRETHRIADSQVRPIDEPFQVGEALLMYPGDITQIDAHPEELHGCRCAIKPILDPNAPVTVPT